MEHTQKCEYQKIAIDALIRLQQDFPELYKDRAIFIRYIRHIAKERIGDDSLRTAMKISEHLQPLLSFKQ